jgi:hypothetical protein
VFGRITGKSQSIGPASAISHFNYVAGSDLAVPKSYKALAPGQHIKLWADRIYARRYDTGPGVCPTALISPSS